MLAGFLLQTVLKGLIVDKNCQAKNSVP